MSTRLGDSPDVESPPAGIALRGKCGGLGIEWEPESSIGVAVPGIDGVAPRGPVLDKMDFGVAGPGERGSNPPSEG